jgi:hypothetical protein
MSFNINAPVFKPKKPATQTAAFDPSTVVQSTFNVEVSQLIEICGLDN